jgi:HPt (histidine-containing phosphotransfer) domain-containing protein
MQDHWTQGRSCVTLLHYAKIPFKQWLTASMNLPRMTLSDLGIAALDDLGRAVAALRPHLDTSDQRADVTLIEEAIARLSRNPAPDTSGLRDFDASRLSHLLDLTGPDLARELLMRLSEDLTNALETLEAGAATDDWKRLREASHVLISLSGSVGAFSLQTMAEGLNAIAHRQDHVALPTIMPSLTGELMALIAFVRTTKAPDGSI